MTPYVTGKNRGRLTCAPVGVCLWRHIRPQLCGWRAEGTPALVHSRHSDKNNAVAGQSLHGEGAMFMRYAERELPMRARAIHATGLEMTWMAGAGHFEAVNLSSTCRLVVNFPSRTVSPQKERLARVQ